MPFNVDKNTSGTFEKTAYLKLTPGTHLVRFLQTGDEARSPLRHDSRLRPEAHTVEARSGANLGDIPNRH